MKLERWKQAMSVESGSVPELPYLAWVPYEVTWWMWRFLYLAGVIIKKHMSPFFLGTWWWQTGLGLQKSCSFSFCFSDFFSEPL